MQGTHMVGSSEGPPPGCSLPTQDLCVTDGEPALCGLLCQGADPIHAGSTVLVKASPSHTIARRHTSVRSMTQWKLLVFCTDCSPFARSLKRSRYTLCPSCPLPLSSLPNPWTLFEGLLMCHGFSSLHPLPFL